MKNTLKKIGTILIIISISLVLFEGALRFLYSNYNLTANIPQINKYLRMIDRSRVDIIQFNPECTEYDNLLFYTLKKNGNCKFENTEFSTEFKMNSRGLRDDEESLKQPEIIVLGDSYAMGWGVNQNETFANLIEEKTKLKTLNTGISSYGTTREYLTLKNQDLSKLKYVVLQYCPNDYGENKVFIKNNYELTITQKSIFDQAVAGQESKKSKKNKPFRMTSIVLRELVRDVKVKLGLKRSFGADYAEDKYTVDQEYGALLLMVKKIQQLVGNDVEIILFDADHQYAINSDLYNYFKDKKLEKVTVFDSSSLLKYEDYFVLDGHYNASGHKKIADKVTNIIQKK